MRLADRLGGTDIPPEQIAREVRQLLDEIEARCIVPQALMSLTDYQAHLEDAGYDLDGWLVQYTICLENGGADHWLSMTVVPDCQRRLM